MMDSEEGGIVRCDREVYFFGGQEMAHTVDGRNPAPTTWDV